jgi:hypothetical protein
MSTKLSLLPGDVVCLKSDVTHSCKMTIEGETNLISHTPDETYYNVAYFVRQGEGWSSLQRVSGIPGKTLVKVKG